jgi:sulfoxide reductase heme-binding subunit YedZ
MKEGAIRVGVFIACLLPFLVMAFAAVANTLGPDPAESIMHQTGEWSLRLLALTLLLAPLRQLAGWARPLRYRRMLGLFAFFYACVHLVSFGQFYVGWDPLILLEELAERPYITAGFAAWLLMLPLTLTSTRNWQRRLGRRWVKLHRLVYPAALAACLHLLWQARSDIGEALVYGLVFALLLGWRAWRGLAGSRSSGLPGSG